MQLICEEINAVKEYFTIGSEKWKITVKYCLLFGFIVGLIAGAIIAFHTL